MSQTIKELDENIRQWLIAKHINTLKKIMIMNDLDSLHVDHEGGDETGIESAIKYWISEAKKFPPQEFVHGIPVEDHLFEFHYNDLKQNAHSIFGVNFNPLLAKIVAATRGIANIPPAFRSDEVINLALSQISDQLKYLSYDEMTKERILLAVKSDPLCLSVVPAEKLDDEIIDNAVLLHGNNLRHLPSDKITVPRIMAALRTYPFVIEIVATEHLTPEVVLAAVERSGIVLEKIPQQFLTSKVCQAAVLSTPEALLMVPEHLLTEKLARLAKKAFPEIGNEEWFRGLEEKIRQKEASPSP